MITLKHYHDGDYHWTVTETDQGRTYLRNTYAMGWDKPNYPMPAIPLAVMWPQAWDKEIDWHNACHFIIIRKTEWNEEWFEGEFVTEYRV